MDQEKDWSGGQLDHPETQSFFEHLHDWLMNNFQMQFHKKLTMQTSFYLKQTSFYMKKTSFYLKKTSYFLQKRFYTNEGLRLPPMPSIREILKLYNISASKHLSQNFLLDENVLSMDINFIKCI